MTDGYLHLSIDTAFWNDGMIRSINVRLDTDPERHGFAALHRYHHYHPSQSIGKIDQLLHMCVICLTCLSSLRTKA